MDLYIIQSKTTGLIKIGRTSNISQRLINLRTGNGYELKLLLLLPKFGHIEKDLHHLLRKYREKGEWFRYEGIYELPQWIYEKFQDLEMIDKWWREKES